MTGNVVSGGDERNVPEFGRAFVARDRELTALGNALARPPAILLIEGEAGIGKSRLVRELLASPEGQRYRYLTVTCPPFREPFTLGPVVDAIRQATGRVSGLRLSGLAGALRPLFPEWAEDLPPAPEPLDDARASRHRLFRALVEILDRLNIGLIALEDAHWADEASLEFCMFVATQPARPMSLVVTYRPEEVPADSLLPRLVSRAPANMSFTRVSLAGLDATGTGELVSAMLGGGAVSRVFAESLCRRTGGIPFVIEQVIRLMYDRADLIHYEGQWLRLELGDIEVPPTIRDAVLERVSRLPPDVADILRAAAVLGEPVDEATLLAVADQPDAEHRVAEALDSGLLVAERGSLALRHALAATAIADTIPTSRRRELHLRAGRTLEAVPGQSVARLAHHFHAAGEVSEWYRYAELAAAWALEAGDHTAAVSPLRDLLTHADRLDRSVLRLVNNVDVTCLRPPGRYTELTDALRSMLVRLDLPPGQRAQVRFPLARLMVVADRDDEATVEMLRVVSELGDDSVTASRAMLGLAIPGDTHTTVAEHLRWLRRSIESPVPDDQAGQLVHRTNRVSVLLRLGLDEGWAAAEELPEDAPSARERHALALTRVNMADTAMGWGWYDRASGHLTGAAALVDRVRAPGIHDMIASTGCHIDWFAGRWDGLAERARVIATDDDALWYCRSEARLVLGLLLRVTGVTDRATQTFEHILAEGRSELGQAIEIAASLGGCWLERGRADEALRITEEPAEVVRRKGIWMWATALAPARVDALLAVGRGTEATELVTRFARGLRGRDMPAPRAALAWCRARVAEHDGDLTGAAGRYARVAAAWRALPRPYDALLAEERQARCLLAAGDESNGPGLLRRVAEGLSDLGASGDANRVARRLREHGVSLRLDRRRAGYGDQLSPRELEVVRLVARGRTNREIGTELSRSPRTVSTQLYSAMRKLGVSSRTELAVRVLDGDQRDPPVD